MYVFFMTTKLINYLKSLKGHNLNALSGNSDGDLEMSIDLRKELNSHKYEDPSANYIQNARVVILLSKWQLTIDDQVKADNSTSYPEVEHFLGELKPEKIEDVVVDNDLKKIEFTAQTYKVTSNTENVIIHDFDFKTTLELKDGEIKILSKVKDFPFVD